jgi:uncharacterized protein (TIGR00159 family)
MELIHNLRWQDVLDILIVAFVFYRLILLIQGTRAVQMFFGLLILVAAAFAFQKLGLHTINWLFSNLLAWMMLAVIILFQPELRRALANVGRTPFFQRLYPLAKVQVLEEVVRACVFLSGRRVGCIIVLQRETELVNYVEQGTTLDAKVSKELLTSIFLPNSPIHDGAVLLKEDRILMAGAFLPLSLDPRISKELGTRHRAAVGISEETDGVAIVVSEETGTISLVVGGHLQRHLDGAALRERLQKIFVPKVKE